MCCDFHIGVWCVDDKYDKYDKSRYIVINISGYIQPVYPPNTDKNSRFNLRLFTRRQARPCITRCATEGRLGVVEEVRVTPMRTCAIAAPRVCCSTWRLMLSFVVWWNSCDLIVTSCALLQPFWFFFNLSLWVWRVSMFIQFCFLILPWFPMMFSLHFFGSVSTACCIGVSTFETLFHEMFVLHAVLRLKKKA